MCSTRGRLAFAVLAVLLAAPGAAGATVEEGAHVEIIHDLGPDATTRAGTVNTLGWVLLDDEDRPDYHQDAVFEVTFENTTLVRTTPSSGHDYDGIDPYRVAFPHAGTFTVTATVLDDGTRRSKTLEGRVLPAPADAVELSVDAPEAATAGEPVEIAYRVTGPDGRQVEHADVQVHVRRALDRFEVLRTTTHAHSGEHTLTYTFDRSGVFQLFLTATPVAHEGDPELAPESEILTLDVAEGDPLVGAPTPSTEQPLTNARETGSNDENYRLFGTYDPYTTVGPYSRIRLGGLVVDADDGSLVPDVAFTARLVGPHGRDLFSTGDLASQTGALEIATSRPIVGEYQLVLDAAKNDWRDTVTLTFGVLPPAVAENNGALVVDLNATGTPEAGTPFTFPIQVDDAAGAPAMHGEVDWRVLDQNRVPLFAGKLHTHENATFPLTLTFPSEGAYEVETLPESLQPTPTPYTFGGEVGQIPVFHVDVADGPGLLPSTDETLDQAGDAEASNAPATGALALAAIASLVAVLAGRRRDA